jgi:SNF2 family DNA or RNA helicase
MFFKNPIEKKGSSEQSSRLTRRVAPFILRRIKEEVAKELPPKTEIVHKIVIEGEQRNLYETIRATMHKKVQETVQRLGIAKSQIILLDALLKLRQVCCDPRLVKLESAANVKESAKLTFLIDLLQKLLEEKRKVILFSSFSSMLELIEEACKKEGIRYVKLVGDTKDRPEVIDSFQNGDVPLFLISLKAGGTGLNLTAADTVIHYDPWWNPAAEEQATDRAHRLGQQKPVFVYKLITEGTIEEKILALQEKKRALIDHLFEAKSRQSFSMNEEDLKEFFAPISSS